MFKRTVIMTLLVLISNGCTGDSPNLSKVSIGILFPMTGDSGNYGEKGQKAIELAYQQYQHSQNRNNREVNIIFSDSKAEPSQGVSAIRKMISVDSIDVVIGDIVSSVTLAVSPIAERNKILLIAPTSSAPAITEAGKFIYRIWPSDSYEGKAIANISSELGYKTVSIAHLNNDYGYSIANIFSETFISNGGKLINTYPYDKSEKDFREIVSSLINDAPEIIYIAGYYSDTAALVVRIKESGLGAQIFCATAVEDERFLELAGEYADGIIYPVATGFDAKSSNTQTANFVESFKKKYRYTPGWVEAHCFDAINIVLASVDNISGIVSGETLKQYIDTVKVFEGATGKIEFDSNGDVVKPVVIKTVVLGKFQLFRND